MTTLKSLSRSLELDFRGPPDTEIASVGTLASAKPGQITFLANPGYRHLLKETQASVVILSPDDADQCALPAILTDNPYAAYARVAAHFAPPVTAEAGIHPSAWVAPDAIIAPDAHIGPLSVIEAGATIGSGTFIGPRCMVGSRSIIGKRCRLIASVTVLHHVTMGDRVQIHPGAVIGSDGFGLAMDGDHWVNVPQLGGVRIGDDCEIGANTTIDRGALEDTILEVDVRLDNQVQIAHNVRIGAHTALAGCAAIAGSATVGRYCMIGGGAGILGHLHVADRVVLTAMTLVTHSIKEAGTYSSGSPLQTNQAWRKNAARFKRLDELTRRVTVLEKKDINDNSDG